VGGCIGNVWVLYDQRRGRPGLLGTRRSRKNLLPRFDERLWGNKQTTVLLAKQVARALCDGRYVIERILMRTLTAIYSMETKSIWLLAIGMSTADADWELRSSYLTLVMLCTGFLITADCTCTWWFSVLNPRNRDGSLALEMRLWEDWELPLW
jgi:hypothetical protein